MAIDAKGKVLNKDMTVLSEQEMVEQAKVFSEGNKELEELLIYLWKNGIQTIGCCSGEHENSASPYIGFYVDKLDNSLLSDLLLDAVQLKEFLQVDVNKGRLVDEFIFDEDGNVVGTEKRERPININFTFKKGFGVNGFLDAIKFAFSNTHEDYEERLAELSLTNEKDMLWVYDILDLKEVDLKKLDFKNIKKQIKEQLGSDINIKVSQYTIKRDAMGWCEHEDNYMVDFGNTLNHNKPVVKNMLYELIQTCNRIRSFSSIYQQEQMDKEMQTPALEEESALGV